MNRFILKIDVSRTICIIVFLGFHLTKICQPTHDINGHPCFKYILQKSFNQRDHSIRQKISSEPSN